jgi:hypothetical protein
MFYDDSTGVCIIDYDGSDAARTAGVNDCIISYSSKAISTDIGCKRLNNTYLVTSVGSLN